MKSIVTVASTLVHRLVYTQVDSASIAICRIFLGIFICFDAISYKDFFFTSNIGKDFVFKFDGFEWVTVLPLFQEVLFIVLFIAGLCVTIGLFYRYATAICLVLITYGFLLAKEYYLNHYYLLIILSFLMFLTPANRRFSVDSRLFSTPLIPYIYLVLLRAQMEIMLIFAGLVKINEDWLQFIPIGSWLRDSSEKIIYGFIWQYDWGIAVSAYGIILLHVVGAPLLLFKRTRLTIFIIYCGFHISNHFILKIGIFPWMTIVFTTLFFDPSWPQKFICFVFRREFKDPIIDRPASNQNSIELTSRKKALVSFFVIWLTLQVLIPLRHYLYPGKVSWTFEGQYFSWRMMLNERETAGFTVAVHIPEINKIYFPMNRDLLSPRQFTRVSTQPSLMRQLAKQFADKYRKKLKVETLHVHVHMPVSYNFRKPILLIDPKVDLAAQPATLLHSEWIYTENPMPANSLEDYQKIEYKHKDLEELLTIMELPDVKQCDYVEQSIEIVCLLNK